jgi:hypothetical protein
LGRWVWSPTPSPPDTGYIERALAQLEQMGVDVHLEDVERVWPLGFQHINVLGR